MEIIKVGSKSNPSAVAGAIANVLREESKTEVQVVGAGALNQGIKAIAIARGFMAPSGKDIICTPTFADINIEGNQKTAIKLITQLIEKN